MDKKVYFSAVPFDKELVTIALESGADGVITEAKDVDKVRSLSRVEALDKSKFRFLQIKSKDDEKAAVNAAKKGEKVVLRHGVEIIPVENILAESGDVGMEVATAEEAATALGILEKGVAFLVVTADNAQGIKNCLAAAKQTAGTLELSRAKITEIRPVGLGHRVCVDTISLLNTGQGMLVGNSSGFTFLINAETESNPYVAPRPFRINAGAVHSYAVLPGDRTCYLEELGPGDEVLIAGPKGETRISSVGRLKTEVRPMLLVRAAGAKGEGTVILQNAETIRLVDPDGKPVSVVDLKPGDEILCRCDTAGRHFGMRIQEDIREK
ncbi:MAG: 3-dehydroquinate synthase II [Desulfonatronovibrionaceae bacterium]